MASNDDGTSFAVAGGAGPANGDVVFVTVTYKT